MRVCYSSLARPSHCEGRTHNRSMHWGKALSGLKPNCFITKKKKQFSCLSNTRRWFCQFLVKYRCLDRGGGG